MFDGLLASVEEYSISFCFFLDQSRDGGVDIVTHNFNAVLYCLFSQFMMQDEVIYTSIEMSSPVHHLFTSSPMCFA